VSEYTYTVPDGIEPIVAWRSWGIDHVTAGVPRLRAVAQSTIWEPRQALHAQCLAGGHMECSWELVRVGSRPNIAEPELTNTTMPLPPSAITITYLSTTYSTTSQPPWPRKPATEPPPGYEWALGEPREVATAPVEACSCGIYARRKNDGGIPRGNVRGEVYLWGKVITATDGYRAEFAYPKAFISWSPGVQIAELCRAYGVPVAAWSKSAATDMPRDEWHRIMQGQMDQFWNPTGWWNPTGGWWSPTGWWRKK
jgi:hypothetical protein